MNSILIIEEFSGHAAEPDTEFFSIIVSSEKSRFDTSTVTLYPAPSDIRISLRCPMRLSDSEAARISSFISDHNSALHRNGFHLHILDKHLCLRSSLYIDDMNVQDGCDALGSMISAMMEKMTLIESDFLQCLFCADTAASAIDEDDTATPVCTEETPDADEPDEPLLPDTPSLGTCEYPYMEDNTCPLPPEDVSEPYDATDPLHNEPLSPACEEDEFLSDETPEEAEEGEPYPFEEDKPAFEADVQTDTSPCPDLSIDLSDSRLRSLFSIPPTVNLRRQFKLTAPTLEDLLQSSNPTDHDGKEFEG